MSEPWLSAHRLPIRVYYEDTDFSGVVYHASYLRFMERGRTEYLREHRVQHSHLPATDDQAAASFAVRRMAIAFHAPARMDDVLLVETCVEAVGGASVTMAQRVIRDAVVLVEASVRIGFVAAGRARRLPRDLVDVLRAHAHG